MVYVIVDVFLVIVGLYPVISKPERGLYGTTTELIVARNLLDTVAT